MVEGWPIVVSMTVVRRATKLERFSGNWLVVLLDGGKRFTQSLKGGSRRWVINVLVCELCQYIEIANRTNLVPG